MTPSQWPFTKNLLMIGGGHTHALVLRKWAMDPLAGVRITVINPGPTSCYSGMLPGYVAGHYKREELDIDLVKLTRFANARLIDARVIHIDTDNNIAHLDNGREIPFDVASIDVGITSELRGLPGATEFGTAAKPLQSFADAWSRFRRQLVDSEKAAQIAVVGGGLGGVELALAMKHALKSDQISDVEITLIEGGKTLLSLPENASDTIIKRLSEHGVRLIEGAPAKTLNARGVELTDGQEIESVFTVIAAGAYPQAWLAATNLNVTNGFVTVDKMLRSQSHPNIFAVGDCAHMSASPRPKAGVFAVRQAPVLFNNLRAAFSGENLSVFNPQGDYLKLVALGKKSGIASKWGVKIEGRAVWQLKDRIDRKFMRQFQELLPMQPPALPRQHASGLVEVLGNKPLCGGCGAKVGAGVLYRTLSELPPPNNANILSRAGDDAAVLAMTKTKKQILTTDHLRAFTNDPFVMAQIAAAHALGDIWAMGATPQIALSSFILPRMSLTLQEEFLRDIIAGASSIFEDEQVAIVGGHTSVGAELTIGFTITGTCNRPITLAGASPGDVLILTKPIGSGTIMAGEMALQAKGIWVMQALENMSKPQGDAARVLACAKAMTDVTGFGLAGHLRGMALASGVRIEIAIADVPFMPGALELCKNGVQSSIYEDNRMLNPDLEPGDDARVKLLFDPQTAGGLVAAIALEKAGPVLRRLQDLGYDAQVIGRCLEPEDGPAVSAV